MLCHRSRDVARRRLRLALALAAGVTAMGAAGRPAAAWTPPAVAPAGAPATAGSLTRAQVTDLQWQLAVHGYDPGPADGVAGAQTAAAIRLYQGDAGLPVDGRPSPALLDHLQFNSPPIRNQRPRTGVAAASADTAPATSWSPPTSGPPAATPGLGEIMRIYTVTVQQALAAKGYRPGPPDGVLGSRTRLAIRKYQRDYHLPVTGAVSLELVNHLRLISGTPLPPQG